MIQKSFKNTKPLKPSVIPSVLLVLLIFFTSCGASRKINETLIIGNWNRDKVISLSTTAGSDMNTAVSEASGEPLSANPSKKESSKKVNVDLGEVEQFANSDAAKNEKFSNLASMFSGFKKTIEFKADKTVIITTQKSVLNGTWEMNGKGNKITMNVPGASAPMKLTLLKIDSTTMEIVDHFPDSDVQILYKK